MSHNPQQNKQFTNTYIPNGIDGFLFLVGLVPEPNSGIDVSVHL